MIPPDWCGISVATGRRVAPARSRRWAAASPGRGSRIRKRRGRPQRRRWPSAAQTGGRSTSRTTIGGQAGSGGWGRRAPAMIAPLSSRPISAGRAPPPCAKQIRTAGRRDSAPLVISAAAATAVSMGIPAPKPSPSPVTRGDKSWSLGWTRTSAPSSCATAKNRSRLGSASSVPPTCVPISTPRNPGRPMHRRISSTARSGSCRATAARAAKRVGCARTIPAKNSFCADASSAAPAAHA